MEGLRWPFQGQLQLRVGLICFISCSSRCSVTLVASLRPPPTHPQPHGHSSTGSQCPGPCRATERYAEQTSSTINPPWFILRCMCQRIPHKLSFVVWPPLCMCVHLVHRYLMIWPNELLVVLIGPDPPSMVLSLSFSNVGPFNPLDTSGMARLLATLSALALLRATPDVGTSTPSSYFALGHNIRSVAVSSQCFVTEIVEINKIPGRSEDFTQLT